MSHLQKVGTDQLARLINVDIIDYKIRCFQDIKFDKSEKA